MTDPFDTWPRPVYHAGPTKHLHAIGVIASCFNSFERNLFDLYRFYLEKHLTRDLCEFFYLSLNERTRAEALEKVVHAYEKDPNVLDFFDSLMSYFGWCWNARNQIVHSEPYPTALGHPPDEIHLTKRKSKQSAQPGFIKFELAELRSIADKIAAGKQHCVSLILYLRERESGPWPLPGKLVTPAPVQLAPHPFPAVPRRQP
jgi:hypothetical protein